MHNLYHSHAVIGNACQDDLLHMLFYSTWAYAISQLPYTYYTYFYSMYVMIKHKIVEILHLVAYVYYSIVCFDSRSFFIECYLNKDKHIQHNSM